MQEQLRLKARAERFKDQLADIPASKATPTKDASKNAAAAEFKAKKKVCHLNTEPTVLNCAPDQKQYVQVFSLALMRFAGKGGTLQGSSIAGRHLNITAVNKDA